MTTQWEATVTAAVSAAPSDDQLAAIRTDLNNGTATLSTTTASGLLTCTWTFESPCLLEAANMAIGMFAQAVGTQGITFGGQSLSVAASLPVPASEQAVEQ